MWMFPEDIADALTSQEAGRIAAALHALTDHLDDLDTWPIRAPAVADLAPFGEHVPEQVLLDLLRIWEDWRDFDPPFGDVEWRRAQLDLIARTGNPAVAYRAALDVRISEDPGAVSAVVAELAARDPSFGVPSFWAYLDHLLDGQPAVRAATVEALRVHAGSPMIQAVRAAGLDRALTEAERARLSL